MRVTKWILKQLVKRRAAADAAAHTDAVAVAEIRCPCCGYLTLQSAGSFEVCPVCYWEDDGQDDSDADVVRGGPNGELSLTQARRNYQRIGACDPIDLGFVRPPRPEET